MSVYQKNKSKANIIIHFAKPYFFVGEYIKGNIEINSNSSALIRDITIEILITEDWRITIGDNKGDSYKKRVVFFKLDLKKKEFRVIDDENILLPVGISFIPFNFRFSEENIPSFEYPLPEKRAFIRYNFVVSINSTNINGSASSLLFLLSRPIIDSEKKLFLSVKQKIKKWKLFGEGDTILNVNYPDDNFKYDSLCKLNIEIDNTNGKITTKELKITLIRTITFKNAKGEIKLKDENKIVREKLKAEVKSGEKKQFEFKLSLKEKNPKDIYNYNSQINPYNINLEKINYFMPSVKGKLIICDYNIKVSLYFESFVDVKHRPRIKFPIYIVHQLPVDYQLEIQEQIEFENALKNSKNENNPQNNISKNNNNYNSNNNYYDNNFKDNQNDNIDEEDDLPSLELIEDVNRKKKLLKNNENNNLNQNEYNFKNVEDNKIEYNDLESCPPCIDAKAPPIFNYNENINNKENININDEYNNNNNNIYINSNDNRINIINDNKNDLINQSNNSQNEEDFSIFNFDNQKESNVQKYEDINAI